MPNRARPGVLACLINFASFSAPQHASAHRYSTYAVCKHTAKRRLTPPTTDARHSAPPCAILCRIAPQRASMSFGVYPSVPMRLRAIFQVCTHRPVSPRASARRFVPQCGSHTASSRQVFAYAFASFSVALRIFIDTHMPTLASKSIYSFFHLAQFSYCLCALQRAAVRRYFFLLVFVFL